MRTSYYVQNFGCRATQADGAALSADLTRRGMVQTAERAEADLVIVNTCTVTAEADRDTRQTIRRIHRENPAAKILVTGCYAQRRPRELSRLPGVRWVVGNSHKNEIGEIAQPSLVSIQAAPQPEALAYHGQIGSAAVLVGDFPRHSPFLSGPFLPGAVIDAGQDRTRPNLKIQDGCQNRCTFCIIPSVRGNTRSAPAVRVLEDLRTLAATYPEVVLTGINLGRWGRDLPGRPRFSDLLRRALDETAVRKLRLSSVEPMDWTGELLALMSASERIAKHVHMPLQSASDNVLKAMRRRYRRRHYADRIVRARSLMPQASIGADVMVGFPGETEEDFETTRRFIAEMPFTYLHVFTYSARPGTPAASFPLQAPNALKKERNRILRELIAEKNLAFRESLVGRRLHAVTLEPRRDGPTRALTDNYVAIDIAGRTLKAGRLIEVEIVAAGPDETLARLTSDGTPPKSVAGPLAEIRECDQQPVASYP